jgi:hypothetical protein
MAPIVIELDDNNCDGAVTSGDIPEIVFTSFENGSFEGGGTLHAISIENGKVVEKWHVSNAAYADRQLAGGDIDAAGRNEIVTCAPDGTVRAYYDDGSLFWKSAPMPCTMPAIADLDHDGAPEIVVEGGILDGATGAMKHRFSVSIEGTHVVSDIDGDGDLDIVTASQAFHSDGTLFVDTGASGRWAAVADLDRDGKPEVVAVHYTKHTISIWRHDSAQRFAWVRRDIDVNATLSLHCPAGSAGSMWGGGPPTIADFDGDQIPDVALAGGNGYAVFSGAKLMNPAVPDASTYLWSTEASDCSSAATGSSVFDFDGDGKAEVIYGDENHLRIYEGPTGKVLWETCNSNGTLWELPIIADVDADGHADIVAIANAYAADTSPEYRCSDGSKQSGVRIFGGTGNWARSRRIWNQHAYHVTNVEDDGRIPRAELANWKQPGMNDFRKNH